MRRITTITLVVLAAMLFWQLNYASLWNPDEGRYAAASLEMATGLGVGKPDWVVPHLNTVPRLNKPPLVYWAGATAMRLLGPTEAAGRLPSALATLGVMIVLFLLGCAMYSRTAGVLGAMVWATATMPFGLGRVLNTDMLLCFAITLSFAGIWLACEPGRAADAPGLYRTRLWRAVLVAGVGMGLALLAKGPVGVALPLLIGFVYLCITKRLWPARWALPLVLSLIVAALIGAPWYLAVEQHEPGFIRHFLFSENLGRFSGKGDYHDPTPFWFYIPLVIFGMLPWSGFLVPTVGSLFKGEKPEAAEDAEDRERIHAATWFLWLWAVLLVGFFSISKTKLITYILPAFPAFCLLVGVAFARHARFDVAAVAGRLSAWWKWAIGLSFIFSVILLATALVYLFNDKTLPRAEAMPYAIALTVVIVVSVAWLLQAAWKHDLRGLFISQLGAAIGMHLILLPLAGHISMYEDASPLIRALKPHLERGDRIVLYRTFQPAAVFYLHRPVTLVDFFNNSGLDEKDLATSPYFLEDPAEKRLHQWLAGSERVYVLFRNKHLIELKPSQHYYVIARNNDYRLISNRPAPAGFTYDFVAPKKLSPGEKKAL